MSDTLKSYANVLLPAVGVIILLALLGQFLKEPFHWPALFKVGLLFCIHALATRGLAQYFPRENLARRSTATLIEQHVLSGLMFGAIMTLFFHILPLKPAQDGWKELQTFFLMALGFGGMTFVASWFERKKLQSKDTHLSQS